MGSTENDEQSRPGLSIVVPFYNEAEAGAQLVGELRGALDAHASPAELILVDDGSSDRTFETLQEACAGDARCCVLRLARNYGQTAALSAGLERARGDVIVILDGDGQNDPQDIPLLLETLERGPYDVVSGWRKNRKDSFLTRTLPSWIANRLVSRMTGVHLHDFGCSLKAYRRRFLAPIRLYGEMHRFLVIHTSWEGARIGEVPVNHRPRTAGRSKYGLERTFKVFLDLAVLIFLKKYATKPIYLLGGFGILSMLGGLACSAVALALKFSPYPVGHLLGRRSLVQTPLPLLAVMLALVGILAVLLGLVAELLTRTYHESQAKPVYRLAEESEAAAEQSKAQAEADAPT